MNKRRRFSAEFKAKVALEVLSGETTLSQLAGKYSVHPNVIANWKKRAKEAVVEGFKSSGKTGRKKHDEEIKNLHAKIGELTVENDFLQKAFVRQ